MDYLVLGNYIFDKKDQKIRDAKKGIAAKPFELD